VVKHRLSDACAPACVCSNPASSVSINVVGRERCFRVVLATLRRASFYLSKVDGLSSEQQLILNMRHYALSWWNYRPQEVWEDVYAERCLSAGKCQSATHARIWLSKGGSRDKRVSGKYEVDFGGQHLSEKFLVKYRKERAAYICE
jgi:hypothetical protein